MGGRDGLKVAESNKKDKKKNRKVNYKIIFTDT
jgi:hypothetical protein